MILPRAAPFVPYELLAGIPNIVVDGPPNDDTLLCLSHWPVNSTPEPLKRDTSTASALAWIRDPAHHVIAEAVSNSHFDEDGLLSMYAVVDPAGAHGCRDRLEAAALAGDFQVAHDLDATRICAVIEALADPGTSPLPREVFRATGPERVALLYAHTLEVLPSILGNIEGWRPYWEEDESFLINSRTLLQTGQVSISEIPSLDLAVIYIPDDLPHRTVRRFVERERARVHPVAVYSATDCMRILRVCKGRMELQYRYETWVQYVSRDLQPRFKLKGFVDWLNDREMNGEWIWEGAGEIAPRLFLSGENSSSIGERDFLAGLEDWLQRAEIGWDPFGWEGKPPAPIPNRVSAEGAA